jgi:hypothetical protein
MFAVSNGQNELSRQLLAICAPLELCKSVVDFLQPADRGLDFSEARSDLFNPTNSAIKVVFMDQGNVAASCKQVAPTMMNNWKQELSRLQNVRHLSHVRHKMLISRLQRCIAHTW